MLTKVNSNLTKRPTDHSSRKSISADYARAQRGSQKKKGQWPPQDLHYNVMLTVTKKNARPIPSSDRTKLQLSDDNKKADLRP
jgi:hypothetical protein